MPNAASGNGIAVDSSALKAVSMNSRWPSGSTVNQNRVPPRILAGAAYALRPRRTVRGDRKLLEIGKRLLGVNLRP